MISKSFEKYINSLKQKKYRRQYQRFIVEGEKTVNEFIQHQYPFEKIIALPEWINRNLSPSEASSENVISADEIQMSRISNFETPSNVLMVAEIIQQKPNPQIIRGDINLVLDGIRDPGNLGTIIRIADWFGVKYIFCSPDCAELYNPKTVQASMGSFCRTAVVQKDLPKLFTEYNDVPVLGGNTSGKNIFETRISSPCFLVIGNEANGISSEVSTFITTKIAIPGSGKTESLNAAVAAGILCAAIRNQK